MSDVSEEDKEKFILFLLGHIVGDDIDEETIIAITELLQSMVSQDIKNIEKSKVNLFEKLDLLKTKSNKDKTVSVIDENIKFNELIDPSDFLKLLELITEFNNKVKNNNKLLRKYVKVILEIKNLQSQDLKTVIEIKNKVEVIEFPDKNEIKELLLDKPISPLGKEIIKKFKESMKLNATHETQKKQLLTAIKQIEDSLKNKNGGKRKKTKKKRKPKKIS